MKPKDKVWQLFRSSEDKSVACKFCQAKYKFANVNKMKNHIKKCDKCPEEAKNDLFDSGEKSSKTMNQLSKVFKAKSNFKQTKLTSEKFLDTMSCEENVSLK